MNVAIRADREGDHARIVPTGPFDLAHATTAARPVENAEELLAGCGSVDVDLTELDRIDGTGAVLMARLLDRLADPAPRPTAQSRVSSVASELTAFGGPFGSRRGSCLAASSRNVTAPAANAHVSASSAEVNATQAKRSSKARGGARGERSSRAEAQWVRSRRKTNPEDGILRG